MVTAPEKQPISAQSEDSRTAHLQPLIDFLKAQGNEPATGDAFYYERDGYGVYGFAQPLDVVGLRERFDFPPSIHLSANAIFDAGNFVTITQDAGPNTGRVINFNL
jgi:hypothetical protein